MTDWQMIKVKNLDAFVLAMERAESKGYLPDAIKEAWGDFMIDTDDHECRAAIASSDAQAVGGGEAVAKEKAAEFMVAARNATMFQDVRELISTLTDPGAKCPGRHLEAQRVLPLLDTFLGNGYTGRVVAFKRACETADLVCELQKALFYWMPSIAGQDSPAGMKAAEHAYLLYGLNDESTDCEGDRMMASLRIRNRVLEEIELACRDLGCPEEMEFAEFIGTLSPSAPPAECAPREAEVELRGRLMARVDHIDAHGYVHWKKDGKE